MGSVLPLDSKRFDMNFHAVKITNDGSAVKNGSCSVIIKEVSVGLRF